METFLLEDLCRPSPKGGKSFSPPTKAGALGFETTREGGEGGDVSSDCDKTDVDADTDAFRERERGRTPCSSGSATYPYGILLSSIFLKVIEILQSINQTKKQIKNQNTNSVMNGVQSTLELKPPHCYDYIPFGGNSRDAMFRHVSTVTIQYQHRSGLRKSLKITSLFFNIIIKKKGYVMMLFSYCICTRQVRVWKRGP